jgi:hypothetical protein
MEKAYLGVIVMNKDIKKVFSFASVMDYKNTEKYFEKMAAKGWMLYEIGKMFYKFKKIEPSELDFNVSLLYENTPYDYPDDRPYKDYEDLCRESGWKPCFRNNIYQIFYKEKDVDAMPIHTDSSEEYRIVKSIYLKTEASSVLVFAYLMFMGVNSFSRFNYEDLLSNLSIFSLVFPFFAGIMFLTMIVPSGIWLVVNRRNAREGRELYFFSEKTIFAKRAIYNISMILYTFLLLIGIFGSFSDGYVMLVAFTPVVLGGVAGAVCVKRFKTVKRTRKQNKVFFLVVVSITIIVSLSTIMIFVINSERYSEVDLSKVEKKYLELSDFDSEAVAGRNHGRNESSFFVDDYQYYYETLGRKAGENELYSISTIYIESMNEGISDFIFKYIMMDEEENYYGNGYDNEFDMKFEEYIIPVDLTDWNADEGYYLQDDKSKIVIKSGNIIYYFDGYLDFSDEKTIEICRKKMNI